MLMEVPLDPRLTASYARQTSAFRRGAALLGGPPEILEIPYEGTALPGYFIDYLLALRDYSLKDRAGQITCPTFVCSAEGDDISASASQLADALNCAKQYVRFTAAEGAGDHCESGARALYHARSFGWLDAILHPER